MKQHFNGLELPSGLGRASHVIKARNKQSCPNKKTRRSEKGSFRKNVDGLAVIINRFVASWPAKDLGIRDANVSRKMSLRGFNLYVRVVLFTRVDCSL